jgi:uracil-DNA glycosylase
MPDQKVIQALPTILARLREKYPDARYELNWETPVQLLVATILAAQSTDERINQVTPGLFAKYPDARAFAEANITELEEDLKPTGFYRNKARAVQGACKGLVEHFGGEVPPSMADLITLDGVARKTANVVLNTAFRIPSGVIVDTHVVRVSQRLGLTDEKRPEKIEQDLMKRLPQDEWIQFGPAMVLLGRYTCTHHAPRCSECILNDLCPKRGVAGGEAPTPEDEPMAKAAKPTKTTKKPAAKKTTAKKAAKPASKAAAKPASQPVEVPNLAEQVPADWREVLAAEFDKPYVKKLEEFVAQERANHQVFPPAEDVFNAFKATPYQEVKVLLLGQDPYHDDGQAHGMCFSVRPNIKPPPSLVNIFKELESDLGCKIPNTGYLVSWAEQGVMLLNTVLTVRAHKANSHKEQGWETFTDAVIQALDRREDPVVFLLWGSAAQKKGELIHNKNHVILKSGHPSPLSSKHFFGTKPFSQTNKALESVGKGPIDWQLPDRDPATGNLLGPAPARPAAKPAPVKETPTPAAPAPASAARTVPPPVPTPQFPALARGLPADWQEVLKEELLDPSFRKLEEFIDAQRVSQTVCPPEEEVFRAFQLTPYERVRVVLLGEEPSAEGTQAHGLSFSVRDGLKPTRALNTIFREMREDLGCWIPTTGDLSPWAKQGVLLLNSILTVRAGAPNSHRNKGWEKFTDGVVRHLNDRPNRVVFVLSGSSAQKKRRLITAEQHRVLLASDPDADRRFWGGGEEGLFSTINDALEHSGQSAIWWPLFGV